MQLCLLHLDPGMLLQGGSVSNMPCFRVPPGLRAGLCHIPAPWLARCLSTRLTPTLPAGAHTLQQDHEEESALTDDKVAHLAKLSNLNFIPGTPEFVKVKSDIERLIGMVRTLQAQMPHIQLSPEAMTALAKADAAVVNEKHAQRRLGELRKDHSSVNDPALSDELLGQPDKVVGHAAVRYGQYFKVPKVIDE